MLILAGAVAPSLTADWFGTPPEKGSLGIQAYTFRNYTFFETVDRVAALDLEWIEMYPGQAIGGKIQGTTHFTMPREHRDKIRRKLQQEGVTLAAYGVVTPNHEADWRNLFEFAVDMNIETIVSEPQSAHLDLVESLAEKHQINVAFHNHAKPARYWNPEAVLEACGGRSERLGACVDTGHWVRSGIDPLEGVRALGSRIVMFHLKDMNTKGMRAHCVPFGTGVVNLPAVFAELKRRAFRGRFSIEYEHHADRPYPDVRECVVYFNRCAALPAPELQYGTIDPWGLTRDVTETWAYPEPGNHGKWEIVEDADTSDFTDSTDAGKGQIEANAQGFPNEHYPNAFDNNTKTKWCVKTPTTWILYAYPGDKKVRVTAYTITTANDAPKRDPKSWRLLGSNDKGKSWTELDARKNQRWQRRFQKRLFKVESPGDYRTYKLDVTENSGDPTTSQLSEIELLEPK